MAGRYPKLGLDYHPKASCYHREESILLLRAAHGWKGYLITLALHDYIFCNRGYYIEWTEQVQERFRAWSELCPFVSPTCIAETVKACLRLGVFDKRAYETCGILTSFDIQHTWLIATRKRTKRYVVRDYWICTASQAEEMQFTAEEIQQSKGNKIFFINKSDIGVIEEAIREHESVENNSRSKKGSESGYENELEDTGDYKISYEQFLQKKRYEGQSFTDKIRCSSVKYYDAPATEAWKMFTIFCNKQITCGAQPDDENKLLEHFLNWLEKAKPLTVKPKTNEKNRPSTNAGREVGEVSSPTENGSRYGKSDPI